MLTSTTNMSIILNFCVYITLNPTHYSFNMLIGKMHLGKLGVPYQTLCHSGEFGINTSISQSKTLMLFYHHPVAEQDYCFRLVLTVCMLYSRVIP